MDLDYATTTELCAGLRDRTISSRELLDHLLARHDRYNPELNAIVALDVDRARVAADAADHAIAQRYNIDRAVRNRSNLVGIAEATALESGHEGSWLA